MIRATWCNSGNVGDRLTPWLINQMTNQQSVYVDHRDPFPKYLACGSVLEWADENTIVWGSGILNTEAAVNPLADIRAVRGPRSRQRAMECGAPCPEVYGDPGLLCPRFFEGSHDLNCAVGVIPHYTDQYLYAPHRDWRYISVFNEVGEFIRQITECEVILSSSLHGLVLADAYGVPSIRVVMGSRLGGDGVKFADYFESVNRGIDKTILWRDIRTWTDEAIEAHAEVGHVAPLVAPLLAACPWQDITEGPQA